MIARTWRCLASYQNVPLYIEHFEQSVLVELRQLKGFREAYILRREVNGNIELTVMTLWESMEAIRSFAGDNVEGAVVAPAAQAILISYDKTVAHSEIIVHAEKM